MFLNLSEIKKHLKKGNLKEIEIELGKDGKVFSYDTISAVLNGRRNNTVILQALIAKAEKNKEESDLLLERTKNL